jgi:hypothetical protein
MILHALLALRNRLLEAFKVQEHLQSPCEFLQINVQDLNLTFQLLNTLRHQQIFSHDVTGSVITGTSTGSQVIDQWFCGRSTRLRTRTFSSFQPSLSFYVAKPLPSETTFMLMLVNTKAKINELEERTRGRSTRETPSSRPKVIWMGRFPYWNGFESTTSLAPEI